MSTTTNFISIDEKNVIYKNDEFCTIEKINFCNFIIKNSKNEYFEFLSLLSAQCYDEFKKSNSIYDYINNCVKNPVNVKNIPLRIMNNKSITNSNFKTIEKLNSPNFKFNTSIFTEMLFNTSKIKLIADFNKIKLLNEFNKKFSIIDNEFFNKTANDTQKIIDDKIAKYNEKMKNTKNELDKNIQIEIAKNPENKKSKNKK